MHWIFYIFLTPIALLVLVLFLFGVIEPIILWLEDLFTGN